MLLCGRYTETELDLYTLYTIFLRPPLMSAIEKLFLPEFVFSKKKSKNIYLDWCNVTAIVRSTFFARLRGANYIFPFTLTQKKRTTTKQ